MADKEQTIEQRYQALLPALGRLETECKYIIEESLQQADIKTHSVLSRVKTFDSTREKIASKEKTDSLDELEDLLGLRIVCLLRSDIPKIGDLIRSEFEVIAEDNKLDGANIEAFGYQSVHFIARLHASCKGRRYNNLHGQAFEIQLRTVAMDAWATLSHYLDYKNETDVPKELRKDFFALSGLFYVADTHFEIFYEARKKSSKAAKADIQRTPGLDHEINLDTFSAYLRKRYPDRNQSSPRNVSNLLQQLISFGYTNFEKIENALDRSQKALQQYEKDLKTKFFDVGATRISILIYDEKMSLAEGYRKTAFAEYRKLVSQDQ